MLLPASALDGDARLSRAALSTRCGRLQRRLQLDMCYNDKLPNRFGLPRSPAQEARTGGAPRACRSSGNVPAVRTNAFIDKTAMSFISYSPNFEDVTLWRALGHLANGTYVDIGTRGPVDESLSRAFHERGWKGLHVTDDAPTFASLSRMRSGDIVIEACIGACPPAMGKAAALAAAQPVITLNAVLDRFGAEAIHWMRVNLGHGRLGNPFESWTHSNILPWVIVVSGEDTGSTGQCSWVPSLLAKGYEHACSDATNHYYVLATHELVKQRIARPCLGPAAAPAAVQRLARAEREILEMHIKLSHAEAHIAMTEERAAKAELDAFLAQERAQQVAVLRQQLHDVYASTSWRVTKPMRWVSRLRRSPRSAIREIGVMARTAGRRTGGILVRRAIYFVLTRPALRRLALGAASHFPGLLLRLKSRIKNGVEPASAGPAAVPPLPPLSSHTTVLGPRFRALILDELQRLEHPSQQEHA